MGLEGGAEATGAWLGRAVPMPLVPPMTSGCRDCGLKCSFLLDVCRETFSCPTADL